jgi:uncharacterized protein YqjF (DUF2071 family)
MQNDFPGGIIDEIAHRPWPLPGSPWLMTQSWHNLLFAHWPVDAGMLRARIPPGLPLDLHDGQAWIGIAPFRMTNVAPRFVPALPFVSEFAELNVRTYVTLGGKPGVYFFSLDAESVMAVAAARSLLQLPYFTAEMTVRCDGACVEYSSHRTDGSAPPADFAAQYQPTGPPYQPAPGTLDYFLTERYCLYNVDSRFRAYRLDIHHPPWKLQRAEAAITTNTMADAAGIRLPSMAPLVHFVRRQDTLAWAPETLPSLRSS